MDKIKMEQAEGHVVPGEAKLCAEVIHFVFQVTNRLNITEVRWCKICPINGVWSKICIFFCLCSSDMFYKQKPLCQQFMFLCGAKIQNKLKTLTCSSPLKEHGRKGNESCLGRFMWQENQREEAEGSTTQSLGELAGSEKLNEQFGAN